MPEEANCNHDLVYLLTSEDGSDENKKRGCCTECSELVNLTIESPLFRYARHPNFGWKENENYVPVYKKEMKVLDQVYKILARPGADIEKLIAFLEQHYGCVSGRMGDIVKIKCSEEDGEKLSADFETRGKDSPLYPIMALSKPKKEGL